MNQNLSICIISKFPPIEGGMSAKAYWLARGLVQKGVRVNVITNANIAESAYRINNCQLGDINGIHLEYISGNLPFHIPRRCHDIAGFVDTFMTLLKQNNVDVIDAHYLIPYGIVAYFLNRATGIPYILRHGGSDIEKFLKKGIFKELLHQVLQNAALVETNDELVRSKCRTTVCLEPYVPDESLFYSGNYQERHKSLRVAYVGKINKMWMHKGLDKIVQTFEKLRDRVELVFLSQGNGIDDFKANCETKNVSFSNFICPWDMPQFYRALDYIVLLCNDNPLPDWPNIVPEALLSGVKVVTDNRSFFGKFRSICSDIDRRVIQVNMNDGPEQIYATLIAQRFSTGCKLLCSYDDYIGKNIEIYFSALEYGQLLPRMQ